MKARLLLLGILLLAFALRLYNVEGQSIWGDEAFSIYTAQQGVGTVLSSGADLRPPLYHLLLHFWLLLTGRTALAVRFLSLGWSLLSVAAGYALARTLTAEEPASLSAAFLVAISPFQIFYAQEARMYAQAAALCALSLLFCVRWQGTHARLGSRAGRDPTRAFGRPRGNPTRQRAQGKTSALPWFVTTLLALYTHYFAFFVLAAENVWLISQSKSKNIKSQIPAWFAVQALMALLYLPWLVVQAGYLGGRANVRTDALSPQGAWDVASRSFGAFFIGTTVDGAAQIALALLFLSLCAIGWWVSRRAPNARLLALALVVPVLGALLVNPLLPYFRERFVLLASLPFIVFVAAGMEAVVQAARTPQARWRLLTAGLVTLLALFVLNQYWTDARFRKGEYDLAIAAIRANAQPADAVLVYAPVQDALYDYYRIDGLAAYRLPKVDLNAVSAQHPRAWLILYGDPAVYDPAHRAEQFLSERGYRSFYQTYRDGALARYDFVRGDVLVENRPVRFGDAVWLTGYALPASVVRGGTLAVSLQWQASAPLAQNYTVFVHLLDAAGRVAAQMDSQPAGGTRPTGAWRVGESIRDNIGVSIPAAVPAGRYRLEIGMYDLQTSQRLAVREAGDLPVQNDALVIGSVEIH